MNSFTGCYSVLPPYYIRSIPCQLQFHRAPVHIQSVNYIVASVLYDQFRELNKDFHHAVGCSGEFHGSIREFRRRHQTLSQSVENADQFMMISNVAGFCCQIINLILVLYCSIFFPGDTIGRNALLTLMHVIWFATILFGLALTSCQGIIINHVVRIA